MLFFRKYWLLILLVVSVSSCVTSKKVNLMQEPTKYNHIPTYLDTLTYEDYKIQIGDRLYLYVYSVDEKTSQLFNSNGMTNSAQMRQQGINTNNNYDLYTYLVLDDGTIDFPLIGHVSVKGLSTREVKYTLEEELATFVKGYGDFSMMSVDVDIVSRSFSVIGANGSGVFPIRRDKVTIYEALAMAGDIGDFGDRSKVRIVREVDGQTVVKTFDIRSKDIINSEYYYIEPNDVIYVQKIRGQAFGINSAATTVSIVATTIAFGGFIYGIVARIQELVKTKNNE